MPAGAAGILGMVAATALSSAEVPPTDHDDTLFIQGILCSSQEAARTLAEGLAQGRVMGVIDWTNREMIRQAVRQGRKFAEADFCHVYGELEVVGIRHHRPDVRGGWALQLHEYEVRHPDGYGEAFTVWSDMKFGSSIDEPDMDMPPSASQIEKL